MYFLPAYGRAASLGVGEEWVVVEGFDGAWQIPLVLRTVHDGTKDAISPYGYSGVYASPSLSSAQVQQAWFETVCRLRELRVISVLLRHSPLVPQACDLPGLLTIVSGHPTIVLEPVDHDSAWSGLNKHCRNRIRKALKNGYTADVRPAGRQDLAVGGDFRRLYEETMHRLEAETRYFFSDRYYEELRVGLGSNLLIAEVRDPTGVVASSLLLMRHGDLLHSHLHGSNPADAPMGVNNLSYWTATQFAIDHGIRQLHLGGGHHAHDSLFRFKHTFGGRELQYRVSGLIVDQELYQVQVKHRAAECHTTPEALSASTYFPAYREGTS